MSLRSVKIVDFDEELVFDNEYNNDDDGEEYDSEDSNGMCHSLYYSL